MIAYIKLGAVLVAVLAVLALGYWLGGLSPKKALVQLQAQDLQGQLNASQAALAQVQTQLKAAQATSDNNSTVIRSLQDENASIAADRDSNLVLVRKLLSSEASNSSGSNPVPQASGGQPTTGASNPPGPTQAEIMVTDAADECERTANQLNSLIAELRPQL